MPSYDYNGTDSFVHKKIVDWDGTTSNVIAKGWDWNGTTSTLFYSGDGNIFPGMAWTGQGANAGTVSSSSLKVILPNNSGKTNSSCRTSSKVDLTNYSKITFVVSGFDNTGGGEFSVGIDNDTSTYEHSSFYKYLNVSKNGTYTLDVSGVSGSYYIAIAVWDPWSEGQGFTVTSITAE